MSPDHAFVLNGDQYVTISGFDVTGNQDAGLAENSRNVTLDQLNGLQDFQNFRDVRVVASSNVTISRSRSANGIELDAGTDSTVITTNQITGGPYDGSGGYGPAIKATDATGTTIQSNTITPAREQGVDLEGASTYTVIENNIIDTFGTSGHICGSADSTPITVASTAVPGAPGDYNLVRADGPYLYSWNRVTYSGVAAFTAATGQGTHTSPRTRNSWCPAASRTSPPCLTTPRRTRRRSTRVTRPTPRRRTWPAAPEPTTRW